MRKIKIFDTTLRDGEQSPGCTMNLAEKLEMAAELDKLGVDIIEAGFAICSDDDFNAIREVSKVVENAKLVSLARCNKKDIDRAYEALAEAKHPMLHTFIATSDIHLKHKLEMTREQVLETIKESVSYAKTKFEFIEFSAEDASRSDKDFLVQAYSTAIENGATTINVPDTVGYATPLEMAELIKYLKENVKGIENVDISVHCHDDLGLATANSLSAVLAGATQIECTINGIGERAGNTSLEEVVMGIKTRANFYDAYTDVNTKRIYKISKLLSTISGMVVAPNKAIVGANAFAHEAGIHQHGVLKERSTYEIMNVEDIGIPQNKMVLGKHSGKHAFKDRIESLGYDIDDKALEEAFIKFKNLADRKKIVTDTDIEALSNIINNDSLFEKYVSILLIGVGAAGLCIVDMLKYLRINKNIMISTIATPFYGTIMADEELAKRNISFFDIPSKIDYYNISRKYHLRRPELRVGSKFLKGMDYSLLEKCKFINFVAQEIEPSRLSKEVFGPISNDGISTTVSQEVNLPGAKTFPIRTSHQDSLFKALEYFEG